jgi:hypothetical protein
VTAAVLVWNATYEPISRTRLQRAMAMVVAGTAVIEEAVPDKWVRHKTGRYPWPKIIRLLKYVRVPFRYGAETWSKQGVLRRDNHKCVFCGKHADTVEHILPTSRGGDPRCWLNTAAACSPCNNKKGDRTLKESRMRLLWEPFVPMKLHLSIHK